MLTRWCLTFFGVCLVLVFARDASSIFIFVFHCVYWVLLYVIF